jgi:hypothetical protein
MTPVTRRPRGFSAGPAGRENDIDRVALLSVKGSIFVAIVALAGVAVAAIGFALADWHRGAADAGSTTAAVTAKTKVLPPPTAFRAEAQADAQVWGYWHCNGSCRVSVKPLSTPATSLWELRVHNAGTTSCYLLDTGRFKPARAASVRFPHMNC